MQRFLPLVGAAGAAVVLFAACGGKVVVESAGATSGDTTTTGGNGGAGGFSSASALDGPFSAVGVTSVVTVGVTSTATVGGGTCTTCVDAATSNGKGLVVNQDNLCPQSQQAFNDLLKCVCAGICATQCSANVCIGEASSPVCDSCIGAGGNGCAFELMNCFNN